jgi:hypothetical protein
MRSILQSLILLGMVLIVIGADAVAQSITVPLPGVISGSYTLSTDVIYRMSSSVRVTDGGVLNIPAGALVYCDSGAVLRVEPGGKMYAKGRVGAPIIFTSAKPQGMRTPGDWGGILLLGNATINTTGGTSTLNGGRVFGGTDDCDSSGVLEYVRIEYAGAPSSADTGVSGLTLAGVGARTRISNVQVSYAGDDSYVWHGGTVNGRRLIAFAGAEDDFDTDLGYRGRLQYLFGMRDSSRSSSTGSNGLESENNAAGSSSTPMTLPVISNLTLAGPFSNVSEPQGNFRAGSFWKNNCRYGLFNSVVTGYQMGMHLEGNGIGSIPPGCPQPSALRLRNTVVSSDTVIWGGGLNSGNISLVSLSFWFVCNAGNFNPGNHPNVGLQAVGQSNLYENDPRPTATSPAATGTSFSDALLTTSTPGTCSWWNFDSTSYKGAFNPNLPRNRQWDSGWVNYKAHLTTYVKHHDGWNLVALANTPQSNHKDSMYHHAVSSAIRFSIDTSYVVDNTLDAQGGYWVELDSGSTVEQIGTTVSLPVTVPVRAGWNLIATGASEPASISAIATGGLTLQSEFFTYNNGYTTTDQVLLPGRAYWVKVSGNGAITFNR